jgi:hypothetical protein
MRIAWIVCAAVLSTASVAFAQATSQQQVPPSAPPAPGTVAPQQPGAPPATTPPAATLPAPAPGQPGAVVPPPVVPPVVTASRTFLAPTGMIFQSVRPERVIDFETVIGLLNAALKQSTDPAVQAQAKGWRVFKATEPGPNNTLLYVFVIDPAVAGADYGIGRILADAYPDKIQEIWKLYTGSLGPGATLLNLTPVEGPPATPAVTTPAPATTPAAPARPGPPPPGTVPPGPSRP